MAAKQKKGNGWLSWALIVFLFAVDLYPVALLLLFWKLFKKDTPKKQTEPEGRSRAKAAVGQAMRAPVTKKSNALALKIVGAVLAAAGLIACAEPINMMIWMGSVQSYYMEDLLAAIAVLIAGAALLASGAAMSRSLQRYSKYLAVMGDRDGVSVGELSKSLGYSERKVEKDLQKMIDRGYFGGKAYLHVELGCLLRGGDAETVMKYRRETEAAAESANQPEEEYAAILRNIRRANDRIADPVLSEKIDRIEVITAKIFKAVEADPKKEERIHTFLHYYLPTTQKLLDSYGEFEHAGIEGENLRQAKQRIEATMDTIVRGFEHQLDELYKSDALDVDADIRVLETMMRWDTASAEKDFGAAARQQE